MLDREAQHRGAHQLEGEGGRRHELGALGAVAQVLVRGGDALRRVAVEQPVRGQALDHEGQLPGQVVRVVDARVGAAHAEDRHQVRGVAGEQHAAVAVALQRQRVGLVDAHPDRLPLARLAHHLQQAFDARHHVLGLDRLVRVLAVAQLVVDAPDVVGLLVHQHGRAGVAGRVEVGQPLGGALAVEQDVDDDVAALVAGALELQAERLAQEAASAIGGDHPVGVDAVVAGRSRHREARAVVASLDAGEPGLPADVDQVVQLLGAIEQDLLDAVLRQVDHRRQLLVLVGRHAEMQHLGVAVVAATAGPRQADLQEAGQGAEALGDLQAAARDADRAAAEAHRVVGLEQDDRHAVMGQAQRGAVAHRAAADHHYRATSGVDPIAQRRQRGIVALGRERVGRELMAHRELLRVAVPAPAVGRTLAEIVANATKYGRSIRVCDR